MRFKDEPGHGAGVTREWLALLVAQLFREDLGLFRRCPGNPLAVFVSSGGLWAAGAWLSRRGCQGGTACARPGG